MTRCLITAVILIGVLHAGSRAEAQTAFDTCSLISAEEMGTLIGAKVRKPRPRTTTRMGVVSYVCTYRSVEDGWTVGVHVEKGRTPEDVRLYVKAFKSVAAANAPRAVAGLGDEAFFAPVNPTNGILHVTQGTDVIWIQTYGKAPGAGSLEKTKAVAERVMARLGKGK